MSSSPTKTQETSAVQERTIATTPVAAPPPAGVVKKNRRVMRSPRKHMRILLKKPYSCSESCNRRSRGVEQTIFDGLICEHCSISAVVSMENDRSSKRPRAAPSASADSTALAAPAKLEEAIAKKKKKAPNRSLETVKHDLQSAFEDLVFSDIPDELYQNEYVKEILENGDKFLYRLGENALRVKIVAKEGDLIKANSNFTMGLLTKIFSSAQKNFFEVDLPNIKRVFGVPINMYRILCYDASEELNTQFIMRNKDKIFTKKDLSERDSHIFKFWEDMIEVGNNVQDSVVQLISFLKENNLYNIKPPQSLQQKKKSNKDVNATATSSSSSEAEEEKTDMDTATSADEEMQCLEE